MIHVRVQHQQRETQHMRSTNNINTIDFAAEAAEGNVFWVVFDMDTQETLMSTADYGSFKWKPLTLSAGDNWGLSELDDTARFRTLDEARQVAEEAADALAAEYPGDEINLEIHRVRLEMVEMIQDIDCEAGTVKRAGSSEDEDEEDDWDVTSGDDVEEEEDEGFESNRFNFNRQREALENLVISNKKPKKVKQSKKKSAKSR